MKCNEQAPFEESSEREKSREYEYNNEGGILECGEIFLFLEKNMEFATLVDLFVYFLALCTFTSWLKTY